MEHNVLDLNKLPNEAQSRLVRLQIPAEDRFVFFPRVPWYYWGILLGGLVWFIYMFVATQDYLWEFWQFWIFAGVTLVIVLLMVFAAARIISTMFGKLKTGFLFTPEECLKTKGRRVEFWNLKELEGFQLKEDDKKIEIWIGTRMETVPADHFVDARKLDTLFDEWRNHSTGSFLQEYTKPEFAYNNSLSTATWAVGVIGSIVLAAGLSFAAKTMNQNFDDREAWKRTESSVSIADFEAYKERHPQGIYAAEADRRIGEIFGKLKDEYLGKVKKSSDKTAVNALATILEGMGKQSTRMIYVKIKETRNLDEEVIKKLRENTGYPVNSYDYSVPSSGEQWRKEKVLNDISQLFLPATRNAAIKFEMNDDPPENNAVMEVNYQISSNEIVYPYYKRIGNSTTINYNPGARFDFDYVLKAADATVLYQKNYVSQFTIQRNREFFDSRDAANYSFEKIYFGAVSEEFGRFLEKQFGFTE